MFRIKKVLFPVDFSATAHGAARYVEAIAGRFQAEITLLHVVDIAAYAGFTPLAGAAYALEAIPIAERLQDAEKWGKERMKTFLVKELEQLDVRREVVQGDPSTEIVAAARNSGVDLIMLPTHGVGVFRRYILGSTAAKVLHDAECPVWTGVHMEEAPELESIHFPKILCAVDLGPQSEAALRWAAGFAAEHSAEVIVAHIVPQSGVPAARYLESDFVTQMAAQAREEVQGLLDKLGIEARVIVQGGEPAKAVSEIARDEQASQLVIARGAVAEGLGRLRTHAYSMVGNSPCPVVSI